MSIYPTRITERLRSSVFTVIAAVSCLGFGACASTGPSLATVDQNLTLASTAVNEAEEVGAQEYAPLELSNAKDKMAGAQQAKADGKHAVAVRMAEEAVADAKYAEMKAMATKADQAAKELRENIKTLREEAASSRDS